MRPLLLSTLRCATAVVVLTSGASFAQSATASIGGQITDPTGRAVPGTIVILTNLNTNAAYRTESNGSGFYRLAVIPPGVYRANVTRDGFGSIVKGDIELHVQDEVSLNFALRVGSVTESVTVEGGAPLINTESAVSTTVDRRFVENLPLNGRSFQGLITLTPGVVLTSATTSDGSDQGQFSVNGQRSAANSFYVDGVSANFGGVASSNFQQAAAGALPALSAQGGTNSLVSVDAMQEFTIQTSTYAPEFGRTPGAQISILTRSGTNDFHGSVFEYFRNDALDANDWFANNKGLKKAALRMNDFGGVFGGPILRDHTFFFFSYEGLPLTLPQTELTDVPSLALRQAAPAALQSILNSYPLPNGPVLSKQPLLAQFNTAFSDKSHLNSYSVRIDHNLTSRIQLFGRYSDAPSDRVQRGPGSLAASNLVNLDVRTQTLTLGSGWFISNALTNDFRFNYSTNTVNSAAKADNFGGAVPADGSAYFTSQQPFNAANASFTFQLLGLPGSAHLTNKFGKETDNRQKQLNFVDNVSFLRGKHSLRFGGDYRRLSPTFGPRDFAVQVLYLSPAFLIPNLPLASLIEGDRSGSLFFNNLGLYGQDTWQVSPRFSLTYGLRWDVDFSPSFANGLQPLSVTSAGFTDPTQLNVAPAGTSLYQTTYGNFAPRVGGAYRLGQSEGHEIVVRGGFGVFYDLASQGVGQIIQVGRPPFGQSNFVLGPLIGGSGAFPLPPDQAKSPALSLTPPFQNVPVFNPKLELPYALQWNAAVEHSLGRNQSLTTSYVAAVGRRLLRQRLVSGIVTPPGATLPVFFNPSLIDNTSSSDYHSLQLEFQRRLSQGLQALASYTWAHSIDTASTGQSSIADARVNFANHNADRGNSSFDIRHTFTAAVAYDIPAPVQNGVLHTALGGWALDDIFTARTAPPVDIISDAPTFATSGALLRPDPVPGIPVYLTGSQYPGGKAINPAAFSTPPLDAQGNLLRQGTLARNSLRSFGAYQLDFALRRNFNLTERVNLQFRSEFFNVFNHPNFGPIDGAFSDPKMAPLQASSMLGRSLGQGGVSGGFNPLFQIGGPRSIQLALKLVF